MVGTGPVWGGGRAGSQGQVAGRQAQPWPRTGVRSCRRAAAPRLHPSLGTPACRPRPSLARPAHLHHARRCVHLPPERRLLLLAQLRHFPHSVEPRHQHQPGGVGERWGDARARSGGAGHAAPSKRQAARALPGLRALPSCAPAWVLGIVAQQHFAERQVAHLGLGANNAGGRRGGEGEAKRRCYTPPSPPCRCQGSPHSPPSHILTSCFPSSSRGSMSNTFAPLLRRRRLCRPSSQPAARPAHAAASCPKAMRADCWRQ